VTDRSAEPSSANVGKMVRWVVVVIVLMPSVARGDDDALVRSTLEAHEAAERGFCDTVRETARKVRDLDPAFYAASFATDATIATCLEEPPPPAAPPVVAPPSAAPPDIAASPPAPTPAPARGVPPLSGGRIVGELLLGGIGALGGGYVGGAIGASSCSGGYSDIDCLVPILLGIYVGGVIGMSTGVYVVGAGGDQRGSFGATLGGAAAGALVGLTGLGISEDNAVGGMLLIGCPIAGALIGFNLSRGYDRPAVSIIPTSSGAVLTFSRAW